LLIDAVEAMLPRVHLFSVLGGRCAKGSRALGTRIWKPVAAVGRARVRVIAAIAVSIMLYSTHRSRALDAAAAVVGNEPVVATRAYEWHELMQRIGTAQPMESWRAFCRRYTPRPEPEPVCVLQLDRKLNAPRSSSRFEQEWHCMRISRAAAAVSAICARFFVSSGRPATAKSGDLRVWQLGCRLPGS